MPKENATNVEVSHKTKLKAKLLCVRMDIPLKQASEEAFALWFTKNGKATLTSIRRVGS
jgi:hypothetical protein